MIVRDLIKKSLQKIGVSFVGTDMTDEEAKDGLDALNILLGSLANDSMMVNARKWETFNLVGGDGLYTIGTGGDFNTPRPLFIVSCYLKDGSTDYQMDVIPDEMYVNQISQKDTTGIPRYLNYDNASPLGNIRLYPVPDRVYQLFLLTEKPATALTLNDEITLPEGWERMLIYNLAVDVSPEYGLQIDPLVLKIAEDSKRLVRANIMRNRTMDSNPLGRTLNFENGWLP